MLADGSTVTVDDAVLRDCILNPSTHVVMGYVPIMPTFQGQISEDGLINLVEYIKSLDTDNRIRQTLNDSDYSPNQKGPTGAAPNYRSRQLAGADQLPAAGPDTSTSKGMGPSPQ